MKKSTESSIFIRKIYNRPFVTVALSPDLIDKIEELSAYENMTKPSYIRKVLIKHIKELNMNEQKHR